MFSRDLSIAYLILKSPWQHTVQIFDCGPCAEKFAHAWSNEAVSGARVL